ncbi:hypothetical protein ACO34A_24480 (plasmid) [Rhizobium sp. ACO-34A]|nr:IclR family transcriptional regulator [Rhizobium sp. ACO-34A]ATN36933.1 hypothetical protein ACO34A_24480 [Rhizobium sp. ACO-34A]
MTDIWILQPHNGQFMKIDKAEPAAAAKREDDGGSQVIARAAAILRTLEAAPHGLTIAEITRASGLPRTTVARLIFSLQSEQLLATVGGRVRLGPAFVRLAVMASRDASALARPHIDALSREIRETVDLWIERNDTAELAYEAVSDQEVRIVCAPGFRLPLHNTAPGKVFLSRRPDDEVAAHWSGSLAAATPNTVTSIEALFDELKRTRTTGLAIDVEEHAEDVCAVAMAVDLGFPEHYAIAIPVPARRFGENRESLERALKNCVAAIEGSL